MIDLSNVLSMSTMTRVALLDNDSLMPVFESAHPMRVSVTQEKKATKFAVEDGTDRSDHVVKQLTEITIDFALVDDISNAYEGLKQIWEENRLVTVQTKTGTYENMLVLSIPHDESASLGTGVTMPIRLQEWVEVKPEEGDLPQDEVAEPKQASTVKRGQVTGTEANAPEQERKGSVISGWLK